jgi:hypothetical protein
VIAAAVSVTLLLRPSPDTPAPVLAVAMEAVQVSSGPLEISESTDGTVVEEGSITVVHRIEGQIPGSGVADDAPSNQTSTAEPVAPAVSGDALTIDVVEPGDEQLRAMQLPAGDPSDPTTSTTVPEDTTTTSTTEPASPTTTTLGTTAAPLTTTTTPPTPTSPSTPAPTMPGAGATTTTQAPTLPGGGVPGALGGGGLPPGIAPSAVTPPGGASSSGSASSTQTVVRQLVTGIAHVGTAIGLGDTLYTVHGQPVVALGGQIPAWRSLSAASDDGADIEQLEGSLVWLGYDPDDDITIDTSWDSATTAAVERWQRGLGVEETGEVVLGSLVFLPRVATVTERLVDVGDHVGDGTAILVLSGSSQHIVIQVPEELRSTVEPGLTVEVDGMAATVTRLEGVERDDLLTVDAVITPNDTTEGWAAGDVVKVHVANVILDQALLVPADALVSRIDGTYVLQTSVEPGHHTFVPIEVLGASGGEVAVRGDGVSEGLEVYRPE